MDLSGKGEYLRAVRYGIAGWGSRCGLSSSFNSAASRFDCLGVEAGSVIGRDDHN
jgi:hypothetical protein